MPSSPPLCKIEVVSDIPNTRKFVVVKDLTIDTEAKRIGYLIFFKYYNPENLEEEYFQHSCYAKTGVLQGKKMLYGTDVDAWDATPLSVFSGVTTFGGILRAAITYHMSMLIASDPELEIVSGS
jgi:hypothetical protein